jgi:hypothetical protein
MLWTNITHHAVAGCAAGAVRPQRVARRRRGLCAAAASGAPLARAVFGWRGLRAAGAGYVRFRTVDAEEVLRDGPSGAILYLRVGNAPSRAFRKLWLTIR